MKRNLLIAILALVAGLSCICGFTACGDDDHVHDYDISGGTLPTCQHEGKLEYKCSICGDKKEEVVPKSGHSYGELYTIKEATCTENGTANRSCIVCGTVKEEIIVPEGHKYTSVEVEKANCQKSGQLLYTCAGCGDSYSEIIPVTNHSYDNGVTTKAATCTQPGVRTFTCKTCSYSYTEAISATGHNSDSGTVITQATCTEAGDMVYHCKSCGEEMRTEVIAAKGHSSDKGTITVDATCTDSGEKVFNCTACGVQMKKEIIPAKGHSSDNGTAIAEATCTEPGEKLFSCSACGVQMKRESIPATGHTPTLIDNPLEATCQYEGKTSGSICSVCKTILEEQEPIAISDHKYEAGKCVWCDIEKQFTIKFVANGETVNTVIFTVSTKLVEEPEVPHIDGYEDGKWESYKLGLEDLTVNAIYTAKKYTLSLEAEEGTLSIDSVKVTFGNTYNLPIPVKTGCDFVGWFDSVEDDAIKYTGANGTCLKEYTVAADKTLYAKWTVKKLTVTFNTDGGTAISSKQYNYGDKFIVEEIPLKTGLTFDGWYSQDGKTQYTNETLIKDDIAVYAKWIESIAVSTTEQFIAIASAPDKNYHLTNDIDLRGNVWSPINNFTGKLDGKNFTIKNFALSANSISSNYGFFRVNSGTIKNVKFADFTFNFSVYVTSNSTDISSVLVGTNNGIIENCELTSGSIQFSYKAHQGSNNSMSNSTTFGTIAGYNNGIINNCGNLVDISAILSFTYSNTYNAYGHSLKTDYYLGGIIGRNNKILNGGYYIGAFTVQSTAVLTCSYMSDVYLHSYSYIGGLIGQQLSSAECKNSFSNISLTYKTMSNDNYSRDCTRLGGAIGQNTGAGSVSASYSVGALNGGALNDNIMGGFVGSNADSSKIISCYSTAETSATNGGIVGGFCGQNASVIQNSYSSGEVNSNKNANIGGFVGSNTSSGTISKCYSTGDVNTVGGNIGHFVGMCTGIVFKCYFMQGATLLSGGKYIDRVVEYETIEGQLYSKLWSEEFLVDELYWGTEGWVIIVDENPLLQWEIDVSHDFQTMAVDPTCEYGGFTIYSCSDCGRLFVKDFKDPLGHDWHDIRTIPPTCTADGYTLQSCTRDGCSEERRVNIISATGHPEDKVSVKDNSHAATCTSGGFVIYHCEECNSDYRVNQETKGHDGEYFSTEKGATCTTEGEDIYFCNVCLEEYTVVTERTEHNWIDVEYKPATCGTVIEDGEIVGRNPVMGNMPGIKCADCGEIQYGCEEINPHKYELIQTVTAATCETDGLGLFKCSECLIEEERQLTALGHTDADRNNICDICGELAFTLIKKNAFTHITDVNGLKAISYNPSGFYWLDNDIDLNGVEWTPLGTEQQPFKGIFYGNNHIISGISFNMSNTDVTTYAGLFGYNKGQIVNLKVSSFNLTVYNTSAVFGGIVAYNYGLILNCALTGTNNISFTVSKTITENKQTYILQHDLIAGGIVGINDQTGSIESCTVSGSITSNHTNFCSIETPVSTIWQLIGQWMVQFIYETKVNTIQHISLGGIAGRNEGTIKACAVTGQVTTESYAWANLAKMRGEAIAYTYIYAGALVGYNTGTILDCSAKAIVYNVTNAKDFINIPDLITGKTYKLGYWIYNYSKNVNAVEGIIGTNSSFGSVDGLTIL